MDVARHWREGDLRYRLSGCVCSKCEEKYIPKRFVCKCGNEEFKEFEFSGKGTLYSYTIVYEAPEGHDKNTPYALGIVDLEEGPKVMAQITDVDDRDLEIGMKLEMSLRKIVEQGEEGLILYGYKFAPPMKRA